MQSFTYAEYLSLALAKVWDRKAYLPSTQELWRLYEERLQDRGGYGRHFQFLGSVRTDGGRSLFLVVNPDLMITPDNIRFFIGWLNDAAVRYGGRQVHSPSFAIIGVVLTVVSD